MDMPTTVEKIVVCVPIQNVGDQAIVLCIEPWANEYTLAPHDKFVVVFTAERRGNIEIEHQPSRLTIYGWETSEFAVFADGVNLDSDGASVEELISFILAGHSNDARSKNDSEADSAAVESVQEQLDAAVDWSQASRDAVCAAVGKLATSVAHKVQSSDEATKRLFQVCETLLRSRGLILNLSQQDPKKLLKMALRGAETAVADFLKKTCTVSPAAEAVEKEFMSRKPR
jgi:hypothetical protein